MGLKQELLRGIYSYGFEKPSTIQQKAIVPTLKYSTFELLFHYCAIVLIASSCRGRDIIAQAQSGTGKTATFSIGVLNQIDVSKREVQALLLAPTRELAAQIQKVIDALGDYMGAKSYAAIGGNAVRDGTPSPSFPLPFLLSPLLVLDRNDDTFFPHMIDYEFRHC